jgi:hypothetical protein
LTLEKRNEGTKPYQHLVSSVSREGLQPLCKKQANPFLRKAKTTSEQEVFDEEAL